MTSLIPESRVDTPAATPRLRLDIWLDVACPWCVVGELRLASALRSLPFGDEVDLRFRSYQLQPDAPERSQLKQPEFLRARGMNMERFRAAQAQLVAMGAEYGFSFNQDDAIPSNTHTAHRLIQAAAEQGVQRPVLEALFSVYFSEGRDVGDPTVLREVVAAAGLPEDIADHVLADPHAFGDEVAQDIAEARRLGISGVPFILVDGRFGISGAQPEGTLAAALATVYAELEPIAGTR
ncbi:DsbA family oxidoreductase [Agromyces italicus]|uniref:DsbA family oxidoreductase n=1 Tax=Agromyces italicus TaxID=279572 RepID=UPI0003B77C12|nr:DsbA family oxidoreductase [Agromyces italicus]